MKILISAYQETVTQKGKSDKIDAGSHVLTKEHVQKIKAMGKNIDVVVTADSSVAAKHADDADVIAGFPRTIPPIIVAKNVKWVHSFSAGMDRVLTPEIIKSSILVSNSSGALMTPIAEHVITYMLIFVRGFLRSLKNQEKRVWQKDDTLTELRGKTVLVAGVGHIGGEVARLAHAFGCIVIGVVRNPKENHGIVDELKNPRDLEKILPRADFVVSCLPDTPETHYLFDIKKFQLMKSSAYFINIGRGGLVNEKDLIAALKKKIIAGAALDVTEIEPLAVKSPLWKMPNVIITPHHSGTSEYSMDRAIDRFCLNLKAFLADERLPNLVNKKLGY